MPRVSVVAVRVLAAGLAAASLAAAQTVLSGRVVNDTDAPVANAIVTARRGQEAQATTSTGASGTFQLSLPGPGAYLVNVDAAGFFRLENRLVDVPAGGTGITLVLNPQREVFQSVDVGAVPTPVETEQPQREQHLSGTEINDIPYPAANSLRNAMKLMPGVIQDPSGGVHFHGGAEYQTQYVLDGFDITDPIDGRFSTRLAVEGVRQMDLISSRESPQYGRGSSGTLEIHTENGTDQLHYTATNFIPGVETRNGVGLGNWTPRAGISGPIVKGRVWFSDSIDGNYNSGYVSGLPSGHDTNAGWALGNVLHLQVNLTPRTIVYGDLMSNFDHQAHFGLGVLDPDTTTTALSNSEWLTAMKVTHAWSDGSMVELGVAWQRSYHQRTPEGDAPYVVAPAGRSGDYFVDSRQDGRRDQVFLNWFPRLLHFAGRHQLQAGTDVQHLGYSAQFQRTSFAILGLAGETLFTTTFQGSGDFGQSNTAVASYVNDHWQPTGRVYVDAGLRQDWDELVGQLTVSPRASMTWAPFADSRTKIAAGFAMVREATNLALFSRPLDQQAVTVPYVNGVAGAPLVTTFIPGHDLVFPRYDKWSAGVEHDFGHRVSGSFEWLRKRGTDGFVYAAANLTGEVSIQPLLLGYGFGGTYALTNQRRDSYDEASVSIRQTFGDQYVWMASYTRSRAVSNAVLDVSVDQPLQVTGNFGRMPWDAPNRIMGWGYVPVPRLGKNWALAFLADWRSGFPFAVTNEAGMVVGAVDSHHYPDNFDLNVHIERRFTFRGYRFGLRVGINNLTGTRNPTAVNSVIGSPQYLQFFGDEGRHAVVRVRFFGRAVR